MADPIRTLEFASLAGIVGQHHIARTVVRGGQSTFAHTHDFPEVFLVEQGVGTHHCNGKELPLRAGTLVLVAPHDVHHFACPPGDSLGFVNLALSPGWVDAFAAMLSPPVPLPSFGHLQLAASEHEQCARALRAMLTDGGADPTLLPAAMALVLRMAFRASGTSKGSVAEPPGWLSRWHAELFSYRGVGQPLCYWQEQAGVSAEHLARSCRRHYGDSPTALIVRARLEWACEQLRQTDVLIVDLAYDAGFDSLSYFYRCFRRAYGCTPLEWLARQQSTVPKHDDRGGSIHDSAGQPGAGHPARRPITCLT